MYKSPSSSSSVSSNPIAHQLASLSSRFEGFQEELLQYRNTHNESHKQQIQQLTTDIQTLTNSINLESKNRCESISAVQNYFTHKINEIPASINNPIQIQFNSVQTQISQLKQKLTNLETAQATAEANWPKLLDSRLNGFSVKFEELSNLIKEEAETREERDKRIIQRLNQENSQLKLLLQQQTMAFETKFTQLRNEIRQEFEIKNTQIETQKGFITKELLGIKEDLQKEIQQRKDNEDNLVSGIKHYSAALQDGIKLIAKQP